MDVFTHPYKSTTCTLTLQTRGVITKLKTITAKVTKPRKGFYIVVHGSVTNKYFSPHLSLRPLR